LDVEEALQKGAQKECEAESSNGPQDDNLRKQKRTKGL
jgi:hypothetical protein